MPKPSRTIDTNILIRFLTADDPQKADAVEKILRGAQKDEIEIPDIIIAEVVWVLLSFYKLDKEAVIEKLEALLSLENIKTNRRLLQRTLGVYRKYNISYTDAFLIAYSLEKGMTHLYSYDEGLDKVEEIKRLEP